MKVYVVQHPNPLSSKATPLMIMPAKAVSTLADLLGLPLLYAGPLNPG